MPTHQLAMFARHHPTLMNNPGYAGRARQQVPLWILLGLIRDPLTLPPIERTIALGGIGNAVTQLGDIETITHDGS